MNETLSIAETVYAAGAVEAYADRLLAEGGGALAPRMLLIAAKLYEQAGQTGAAHDARCKADLAALEAEG